VLAGDRETFMRNTGKWVPWCVVLVLLYEEVMFNGVDSCARADIKGVHHAYGRYVTDKSVWQR